MVGELKKKILLNCAGLNFKKTWAAWNMLLVWSSLVPFCLGIVVRD